MSVRWTVSLPVCLAAFVATAPLLAQSATGERLVRGTVPPSTQHFQHGKKLRATYDSVTDSTHLAVVTHRGKYFLTVQRPRLTWIVTYAGRTPGTPPVELLLEFRTQTPQVAFDSRLLIQYGAGKELEVASAGAYSDPGVQTWSHFMRFRVPCASMVEALAGDEMTVSVGGVRERFKPDHLNALRDLLSRVGAWTAAHPM
ncbi:MAG: hypothetical protein ACREMX_13425 [Gemmatimonadales bacterium]